MSDVVIECLYRCECGYEFEAVCRPSEMDGELMHLCEVPPLSLADYGRDSIPVATLDVRRGIARPIRILNLVESFDHPPRSRHVVPVSYSLDQGTNDIQTEACWRCDIDSSTTDVGLCRPCLDDLRQPV